MISWLASYPKSGNTFVRHVVEATLEGTLNINTPKHCRGIYLKGTWHTLPFEILTLIEQTMFVPACLMAQMDYDPMLLTKTHHANFIYKGWQLLPQPLTDRAIYIVRDPRDVAISHAEHFGISLDESIQLMNENERIVGGNFPGTCQHFLSTWSNHVKSYTQFDPKFFPVHTFKYENLLTDPEGEFARLFAVLEVETTPSAIHKGIELAAFSNVQAQEEKYGFIESNEHQEQFFTRGTAGHWRDILTKEQAAQIVKDHGPMMAKMGYSLK